MRILITGATGFVGGWLAQELARAYPEARLFGMGHLASDPTDALPPNMDVRPVNLTDSAGLESFVAEIKPEVVFHLAGFASGAGGDRERIFQINVGGTTGLLSALAEQGTPCRVHLASSGYVYGVTQAGQPAVESDAPAPVGAYAESKTAMEAAAQPFAIGGLSLTVTRSFNHTGPRQGTEFAIPAFAQQVARIEKGLEEPVVRHGNLETVRDFLDVRDVVRAYRLLLLETEPALWRVVNVASGQGRIMRDVLEALLRQSRVPATHETDPAKVRPSDMPECVGNPSLLHSLTGWKPEIPFAETLAATLDYWRNR